MAKIFVDMDGTLAKFYYHKKCLEKMYEREYFLRLKPYKIVDYIRKLVRKGKQEVYIPLVSIRRIAKRKSGCGYRSFCPKLTMTTLFCARRAKTKRKSPRGIGRATKI